MALVNIPIGQKPYYNIDPSSKGMTISDAVIDGFIDEAGNITRRAGLSRFANTGSGMPGQGIFFWEQQNLAVLVNAGKCYTMDYSGTLTDISGSVQFSQTQPVIFSAGNKTDGSPWLYIADGGYPIYTTGAACARITAASGSPAQVSHIAWLASRFVVLEMNSRKFYASDTNPNTGNIEPDYFLAVENPLTAEVAPDNIKALFSDWDELYVWGSQGLEVWRDDNTFFSPIDGAFSPVGLIAPYSIARADNTVFALCTVDGGMKRAIVKMQGRTPQAISLPIERILNAYTTVDDAIGFLSGDSNYVLTFPSEKVTWSYNYVTDKWNQWSCWNAKTASREEFLGRFSAYAWGNVFMLSRLDGSVYVASISNTNDDGQTMRTEYVTGHIDHSTPVRKRNHYLRFRVKRGASDSYTEEPSLMVRYRDNGKNEWEKEKLISLGHKGQYEFFKTLWNMGLYRTRQYSFVMTDSSDLVISNISEDVEALRA